MLYNGAFFIPMRAESGGVRSASDPGTIITATGMCDRLGRKKARGSSMLGIGVVGSDDSADCIEIFPMVGALLSIKGFLSTVVLLVA